MNSAMNARRLRTILIIVMLLIISAVAGGFVYAQKSLTGYAQEISQLNANADTGDQSIATLKNVENRLKDEKDTIEAAHSIVADSATFAERVVSDVTRAAAEANVAVKTVEFVDTPATGSATPTTTPTTTAPVAATTNPLAVDRSTTGNSSAPAAPAISQKSISIAIESPVKYSNLMDFIRRIESNEIKLQIASVNLTKGENGTVTTQTFSIGAYVR